MTGLELGILKRFDRGGASGGGDVSTSVVWDDEYVDVGRRAIGKLIGKGLVERVYAPSGREGVRITPSGRLARARYR